MTRLSRRQALVGAGASVLTGVAASLATSSAHAAAPKWDQTVDVLVAGGGAAGTMAAIRAARAGARVLLVQASPVLGGNSAISSGWIRSACTKWHQRKGIQDSAESYAQNILAYGNGTRNPEKAKVIAEKSRDFVDFLIDAGVPFTDDEDRFNGGETLRVVKALGGGAVMKGLIRKLREEKSVEVRTDTRLVNIVLTEDRKAVAGAVVEQNGKKTAVACRALVLATGGFGRNQAYIERFTNQWAKTGRIMDIHDMGDGLRLATELGARRQRRHCRERKGAPLHE